MKFIQDLEVVRCGIFHIYKMTPHFTLNAKMKNFDGMEIEYYIEESSNATITQQWTAVESSRIKVEKGIYIVTLKYSVPYNQCTYYPRIFCGTKEIARETKVANIYYNLKGTLTGICKVETTADIFGDNASGEQNAIGKSCSFTLSIAKIG